ncbi:hypothetical protein DR103_01695 [Mycoplasma hyorhinis]|uniref:hypothetical protein n=1 Tax=Mesomycoplasma hyorhinis TaxID=2100 RepID=UPI00136E32B3|nr:hypothetical protein [Mesomycoplasma hyorhinis]MXR07955.1 hypothetical protein [Mesomycoplasma hyorhinis]
MILNQLDAKKYKNTAIHFFVLSVVAFLAFIAILAYYIYYKAANIYFKSFIVEGIIVVGFLILFIIGTAFFAGFYVYHKDLIKYKKQQKDRDYIKNKVLKTKAEETKQVSTA